MRNSSKFNFFVDCLKSFDEKNVCEFYYVQCQMTVDIDKGSHAHVYGRGGRGRERGEGEGGREERARG